MSEQRSTNKLPRAEADVKVFEDLKSLVGSWKGRTDKGRLIEVAYTLHANDSVLMESWALGPMSDALTLYHMDSAKLMATHYCPLCNQPRLLLTGVRSTGSFAFEFSSATNLPDPTVAHQRSFEVSLLGPDSFWRSETYIENGTSQAEAVTYHRVGTRAL